METLIIFFVVIGVLAGALGPFVIPVIFGAPTAAVVYDSVSFSDGQVKKQDQAYIDDKLPPIANEMVRRSLEGPGEH